MMDEQNECRAVFSAARSPGAIAVRSPGAVAVLLPEPA